MSRLLAVLAVSKPRTLRPLSGNTRQKEKVPRAERAQKVTNLPPFLSEAADLTRPPPSSLRAPLVSNRRYGATHTKGTSLEGKGVRFPLLLVSREPLWLGLTCILALLCSIDVAMNHSEIEIKVREATNGDEQWGPHGSLMNEIAKATYSYDEFPEVSCLLICRLADSS